MGIGDIEPNRIFERLYRSGSAVAQQVPGAGLGLTIALAIVEAHHGTIGVVKSDNHGTTFRMSFPMPCSRLSRISPTSGSRTARTSTQTCSSTLSRRPSVDRARCVVEPVLVDLSSKRAVDLGRDEPARRAWPQRRGSIRSK